MIERRRRFCGRDFLLGMLIAGIFPDYTPHQTGTKLPKQMVMAIRRELFAMKLLAKHVRVLPS
jgi:hypothetical protein